MLEKNLNTIMMTVLALIIGWAGFSIIQNGKAVARMEPQVTHLVRQVDKLLDRNSLAYNFNEEDK